MQARNVRGGGGALSTHTRQANFRPLVVTLGNTHWHVYQTDWPKLSKQVSIIIITKILTKEDKEERSVQRRVEGEEEKRKKAPRLHVVENSMATHSYFKKWRGRGWGKSGRANTSNDRRKASICACFDRHASFIGVESDAFCFNEANR